MDGGTVWNANMISGIQECFKIPGIKSEKQIELDVISTRDKHVGNFTTYEIENNYETLPEEDNLDEHMLPLTIRYYLRRRGIS